MHSTILIAGRYGGPDVLEHTAQELGTLAPASARIEVKAAGVNPVDAKRMTGQLRMSPLPQVFGTEFAGVIVEVGPGTHPWAVGDEVLGSGDAFTHATVIDVPLANLVRRPATVDWTIAGSLAGAGQTALTILEELGDISSLLIHGASGAVGSVTAQLARARGIEVVGTASAENHDHLRSLGVTPVNSPARAYPGPAAAAAPPRLHHGRRGWWQRQLKKPRSPSATSSPTGPAATTTSSSSSACTRRASWSTAQSAARWGPAGRSRSARATRGHACGRACA